MSVISGKMCDPPRIINTIFLCDEWKSSEGGLSAFNREFAVNLAKYSMDSIEVHCYVTNCDDTDREDAKRNGVNLISAKPRPGLERLEWLKFPPSEIQIDVVVGHGQELGPPAYFIKHNTNCKWVQFVHTFCEDHGEYKVNEDTTRDVKHVQEKELCKAADKVVAIGSLLQEKYQESLPDIKVEKITPGILEAFSIPLTLQLSKAEVFNVFVIGRGTFVDPELKGYDIIGNAIASLGENFKLHFVGLPSHQHNSIKNWLQSKSTITTQQLTVHGFCNQRDQLRDMLKADVVALPSRLEGFGLIALEAISACIPVLVSNQSGIAKALEKVNGGDLVVVESESANEWAERILQLSKQTREERLINAVDLREHYGEIYAWSTECKRFERMICDLVEGSQSCQSIYGHKDASSTGVYHFIHDLIVEGKDAWFVNNEGRYAINWLRAPMRYHSDYKSRNDNVSSRKASNNLRSALLNSYEKEGAKEYKECQKRNDKGEIVERQFQMPPMVLEARSGSDVLLMNVSSEQETCSIVSEASQSSQETPHSSDTGFEEDMDSGYTEFAQAVDITFRDFALREQKELQELVNAAAEHETDDLAENSEIHLTENKLLHLTAKSGNIAIIEKLLSRGCDINARDSDETTPLMIAAFNGKAEVVSFLLKNGADAFLESEDGGTLLHFASRGGNVTIIEKVVRQGVHIDSTDGDDNTPLMYAAFDGKIQVVNCLLNLGADPFLQGRFGRNALHWASSSGNIAVIEALLSHGVEVDSRDWSGKTSLMYAASLGKEEAVTFLLHMGSNPSLKSNLGKNLLHFSSQGGSIPIIEAMLSLGLDVNSRDDDGNTPLTIAGAYHNFEAKEYLLDKGPGKTLVQVLNKSYALLNKK